MLSTFPLVLPLIRRSRYSFALSSFSRWTVEVLKGNKGNVNARSPSASEGLCTPLWNLKLFSLLAVHAAERGWEAACISVPGTARAKSGSHSPPRSTEPGESAVGPGICTPKEHPSMTLAHSPPPQCLLPWFPGRLRTCRSPTWRSAMWGSPPLDSLLTPSFSPWCRVVPKALGEVM